MSVLAGCLVVSLATWLWLLLGHGSYWRTDVRLPPGETPSSWPSVAIVVPARNEAEVLPSSLPTLLAQDYPGQAEILLIDDGSTDGTGALARELASHQGGLPLTVDTPGEPEPGWTGKLWALRHGIELAQVRTEPDRAGPDRAGPDRAGPDRAGPDRAERAPVDYLLLTDADIAHAPDSLRELVRAAHGGGWDLVSQMARLRAATGWERLIVPAFVYFFAQLYPFRRVNRPGARTAAAAGGCVLLRSDAAQRAGVPSSIRHELIDDVALARAVQRTGGRIWLGLADRVESVRPYPRLAPLWQMVARSAYAQLRHSPVLLAATVLGLTLLYLLPPAGLLAAAVAGRGGTTLVAATTWAVMAATYRPMLRYYAQPAWLAPLLPAIATLYLVMTLDSAARHHRGGGAAWKGRSYPHPKAAH